MSLYNYPSLLPVLREDGTGYLAPEGLSHARELLAAAGECVNKTTRIGQGSAILRAQSGSFIYLADADTQGRGALAVSKRALVCELPQGRTTLANVVSTLAAFLAESLGFENGEVGVRSAANVSYAFERAWPLLWPRSWKARGMIYEAVRGNACTHITASYQVEGDNGATPLLRVEVLGSPSIGEQALESVKAFFKSAVTAQMIESGGPFGTRAVKAMS